MAGQDADALRRAAATLRERAEAATPGPWRARLYDGHWQVVEPDSDVVADCDGPSDMDNAFIATMHPGVALALADLLDATAVAAPIDPAEPPRNPRDRSLVLRALAVAAAILGSPA